MRSSGCAGFQWQRNSGPSRRGMRLQSSRCRLAKKMQCRIEQRREARIMNVKVEPLRQVITTEQIQKRVKELGRQISDDYQGQTVQMLAVLENAFMFLADLVRAMEVPVVCQFIKPRYSRPQVGAADVMEIFFSHEPDIRG